MLAHPGLKPLLAELTPEHFYDPVHRALRAHIVDGGALDADAVGLLAELDARAVAEGIDESTGTELLLRLREREMRRELQHSDPLAHQGAAGGAATPARASRGALLTRSEAEASGNVQSCLLCCGG